MTMQAFTSNFADNSTESGYQFTFYCDCCKEGYKTKFIESKSYSKGKLIKGIGSLISAVAQMTGKYNVGYGAEKGADIIGSKFSGMTAEWQKEHETAFELAQNEAKGYFKRCPKCKHWMCENDWNEQEGLCVTDAPRVNIEVAAAKAQKMIEDIKNKAAGSQVFTGEIESKQTTCPKCGKPAGEGKFCNNCGAPLGLRACAKCGAQIQPGTQFCGECGTKMG